MTSGSRPRRHRSKRRIAAIVLGSLCTIVLVAGLALAWFVGPRFNVWLVKPSPERYAEHVVSLLDGGYHARGPEWDKARAELVEQGEKAAAYADLYPVIKSATKVAGGKHSFFRTPGESDKDNSESVGSFRPPALTTADEVSTIVVPDLGFVGKEKQQEYADAGARAIEKAMPGTCGWIVDLRGNTGGDMYPMFAALSPLLPDGPALSFRSHQGADLAVQLKDGGAAIQGAPVVATGVRTKIPTDQRVAVLYDGKTASSAEAVATAFRGLPNVRSFGTATAGYTSANGVNPLPDGSRLVLTTSAYVDRAGVNLDEQPMQPDQATSAGEAAGAAASWVRQGACR